ncbi:MAG: cation-translocating P-type ATPase, partial [Firmicutes bacterium]|nr:cation-translocating P-type ATPase [Bacillota bacterium]
MVRFFKRYRKLLLQFNSIIVVLSGLALALSFIFKNSLDGRLSLVFTLMAVATAGFPIIYDSLKMIFKGKINVGILVSTAIIASLAIREYRAAAIVAFIMMAGEFLENLTVARASMAIKGLLEITPTKATVRRDGKDEEVSVSELNTEDLILVKSGERIPVDGVVTGGSSCVDQSTITGESMPAAKETGDEVFAGTLNQVGALEIKVTKTGGDTTLGQIVRLVESAQKSTAPVERTADKFARYFVPVSFLIAVIVYLLTGEIIRAITVLIVACPCALVLATPTAIIAGIGNAARAGIVVKGGIHLENAGKLDLFAFDKTGTLTKGTAKLTNIVPLDGKSHNELLVLAATVEKFSEHPLAKAILREAGERNLEVKDPEDFAVAAGFGVKARIDGENINVGTRAFLAREGIKFDDVNDVIKSLEEEGKTVVLVSRGRKVLGLLGMEDAVREGAADAV